jgi:hypothetical protein
MRATPVKVSGPVTLTGSNSGLLAMAMTCSATKSSDINHAISLFKFPGGTSVRYHYDCGEFLNYEIFEERSDPIATSHFCRKRRSRMNSQEESIP